MSSAISRPMRRAASDEAIEVVERAEPRLDRRVAALRRADRPRAARIVGRRRQRIVASLAEAAADRMDRRQVEDVEAHRAIRRAAAPPLRRTSRCATGSVPAERGNISYHAPKRARSRSTSTLRTRSIAWPGCDRRRGHVLRQLGRRARRPRRAGLGATCPRASRRHPPAPVAAPRRASCHAPPARATPLRAARLETSWPAAAFFDSSCRQVSKRSIQPSMVYS